MASRHRFGKAVAGKVDLSRIERAADATFSQDGFINFPGTLFLDDVRFNQFIADPHSKPADRSVLR